MKQHFKTIFSHFAVFALLTTLFFPSNVWAQFSLTPNDPLLSRQNYLKLIQAPEAWALASPRREVVVAVLDTGVDVNHPDLKDAIWRNVREIPGDGLDNDGNGFIDDVNGWDFVTNSGDPSPKFTPDANPGGIHHGTLVAGIIAARGNNGIGIAGINWTAKIMSVRLLNGSGFGVTDKVDDAIRYAVKMGANVINLSFTSDTPSKDIEAAIAFAYAHDVVVVTAAGNDLFGNGVDLEKHPIHPACADGGGSANAIITVAATDENDHKASFSNFGKGCVDISAPGENIFGAQVVSPDHPGYEEAYASGWSGTSVSAPMVAGAASLIMAHMPNIGASEVVEILRSSADPIDNLNLLYAGKLGAGRLNIAAAVARAGEITRTVKVRNARIVTAKGPGGQPLVQAFTPNGDLVASFLAYGPKFTGGVRIAVGDVDGDGNDDIITAPGPGGGPHIRVFSMQGALKGEFFAYNQKFLGGVSVAVGDLDSDGVEEIITAPGAGAPPQIRGFRLNGKEVASFFVFSPKYLGGVQVAVGDLDGDRRAEIVAAMSQKPWSVRSFTKDGALQGVFSDIPIADSFSLALVDTNGDGKKGIIFGLRRAGSAAVISSREGKGFIVAPNGPKNTAFLGLASFDSNGSGKDELLIISPGKLFVEQFSPENGKLTRSFQALVAPLPQSVSIASGAIWEER